MKVDFVVDGTPASYNVYRAGGAASANARAWKRKVGVAATAAWVAAPTQSHVSVQITYFYSRAKGPDVDNIIKLMLDAMERIVFVNDKQVYEVTSQAVLLASARLLSSTELLRTNVLTANGDFVHVLITDQFLENVVWA